MGNNPLNEYRTLDDWVDDTGSQPTSQANRALRLTPQGPWQSSSARRQPAFSRLRHSRRRSQRSQRSLTLSQREELPEHQGNIDWSARPDIPPISIDIKKGTTPVHSPTDQLPFLIDSQCVLDFANFLLDNPAGPMLMDGRRAPLDSACALFDDLDEFPPPFPLSQHDTDAYNHLREHVNDTTTDFQNELPTLQRLLWQFRDVWLPQNWKPGTCNIIAHHIILNDPRPIVVRPKHYTEEQQEVIIAETESMLRDGIIEHSNSPYAFEPSLVMKPDGRWRFCVNY